jgi:hypothetical protein
MCDTKFHTHIKQQTNYSSIHYNAIRKVKGNNDWLVNRIVHSVGCKKRFTKKAESRQRWKCFGCSAVQGLTSLNTRLRKNSHRWRVFVVVVPDLLHNCTCNWTSCYYIIMKLNPNLISLSALLCTIHNASTEQTFALYNYIIRNTAHELSGSGFFITFNI